MQDKAKFCKLRPELVSTLCVAEKLGFLSALENISFPTSTSDPVTITSGSPSTTSASPVTSNTTTTTDHVATATGPLESSSTPPATCTDTTTTPLYTARNDSYEAAVHSKTTCKLGKGHFANIVL